MQVFVYELPRIPLPRRWVNSAAPRSHRVGACRTQVGVRWWGRRALGPGHSEGPESRSELRPQGEKGSLLEHIRCIFASAPRGRKTPYNLAGSKRTARTDSRSTMSALMRAMKKGPGSPPTRPALHGTATRGPEPRRCWLLRDPDPEGMVSARERAERESQSRENDLCTRPR